ncbi:PTS glucose transporter subunit IIA [Corynebacterium nasicanis]
MFGFGRKSTTVDLGSPFAGEVIPVTEVEDPVFAGKMVGDGFAVRPRADAPVVTVCAPAAGELVTVFKTGHAFALRTPEGLEVLVHIGLDTVELKGEGFTTLAAQGETVAAGQPIVEVDLALLRERGRNPVTPVVMSNRKQVASVEVITGFMDSGTISATVTLA